MKPIWSWTTGMRFCFDRAFNSLPPSPHRVHRGRFAGGYFGWVVAIDSRVDVEHRLRSFLGSAYFVYSFSFAITSRRQPSRRATIALRFHSEERHDKSIINQIYLLSTWFTCPGALYCMQLDGMNFNCKPHHPIAIYLVHYHHNNQNVVNFRWRIQLGVPFKMLPQEEQLLISECGCVIKLSVASITCEH